MSQDSAKQFIQACKKDQSLKKALSQAKNETEVSKLLQDKGYSFTGEEYKAAAKEILGHECSPDELKQITGGIPAPLAARLTDVD